MRTALRAAAIAALVGCCFASDALAAEGGWFGWLSFSSKKDEPQEKPQVQAPPVDDSPPPRIVGGLARSTRSDAKTPVILRGVQNNTRDFFDTVGGMLGIGPKKTTRRPVSAESRRVTTRKQEDDKPWYDFWSGEPEPEEPMTVQSFLKQDRPEF